MKKPIKEILHKINSAGFESYIVGGYVRDTILGIESFDIDICTSALPKDLISIFKGYDITSTDYGNIKLINNKYNIDITTYRKELDIVNRRPTKVEYITSLEEDLQRRDFTMNAVCMDEDGNLIDLLGGIKDIRERKIKCIKDIDTELKEDPLRILRAIRFATILDFDLDKEIIIAIAKCKHLLNKLSYNRKKEELDKIFSSSNAKKGIKLLIDLGLDKELELERLNKIKNTSN